MSMSTNVSGRTLVQQIWEDREVVPQVKVQDNDLKGTPHLTPVERALIQESGVKKDSNNASLNCEQSLFRSTIRGGELRTTTHSSHVTLARTHARTHARTLS